MPGDACDAALADQPLFLGVPPDQLAAILNRCRIRQLGAGDTLLAAETGDGEIAGYALGRSGPVEELPEGAYDAELVSLHVRRALQKHVESPLSVALLSGQFKDSRSVLVDVDEAGENLVFRPQNGS